MKKIRKILLVYSEIFFSESPILGFIIAIATFIDPNTGLAGVLAIFAAYAFSRLIPLDGDKKKSGFEPFYYYNPLLVGLSIGVLFKVRSLTLILVLSAGILTYVLTVGMNFFLKKYTGLPVLSIPFVVVSSFVYLATLRSSNLFSNYLVYQNPVICAALPTWINGFFLSLGSIFFSKNVIVGILIAIALLLHSRIAFFLALAGYYIGALVTGGFNASFSSTYMNMNYFNFILIAIAIGSVYLIPSIQSYLVALFAVVISYIILGASEVLFDAYGIPVFTLPFNMIVLVFIYYTDITGARLKTRTFLKNPEANLDFYLNYTRRFGLSHPAISLPFSGKWKISQGFDDDVTHKGAWKYGIDFVMEDENQNLFRDNPCVLKNYFGYDMPVLSPVSGTVATVENSVEDNEIDSVNREENWGNFITIYDPRGFYVRVCHLKKGSIIPPCGTTIRTGQWIARTGNSGYSPFPHIHIQVQTSALKAATTREFCFEQVHRGEDFQMRCSPKKGDILSPVQAAIRKKKCFELLLGDKFKYICKVERQDKETVRIPVNVQVVMDSSAGTCLADGTARLYFEVYKNLFRFYKFSGMETSPLKYFFLALPSIPLTDVSIGWRDELPLNITLGQMKKNAILLVQSLHPDLSRNSVQLRYRQANLVEGINRTTGMKKELQKIHTEVRLHREKFIESIRVEKPGETVELGRI